MPTNNVDHVVDKWLSDPAFKTRFANDAEGTIAACGVTLNSEEWATFRNAVMGSSNEQLLARISKGGGGYAN